MTDRRPNPGDLVGLCGHRPETTDASATSTSLESPAAFWARPVLYPERYCWYVLVCALDLMLTNTVINYAGAIEANELAARAIEAAGFWGLIAMKIGTMLVVLTMCEAVGARQRHTGRRLAEWAVAISSIPVVLTMMQLGLIAAGPLLTS